MSVVSSVPSWQKSTSEEFEIELPNEEDPVSAPIPPRAPTPVKTAQEVAEWVASTNLPAAPAESAIATTIDVPPAAQNTAAKASALSRLLGFLGCCVKSKVNE